LLAALIGRIGCRGESLQELGSGVAPDRFSIDRDPKILLLVVGRALFGDSRYLTCKNDKRGGGQRKSGDLKMLVSGRISNRLGGSSRGTSYTELEFL